MSERAQKEVEKSLKRAQKCTSKKVTKIYEKLANFPLARRTISKAEKSKSRKWRIWSFVKRMGEMWKFWPKMFKSENRVFRKK